MSSDERYQLFGLMSSQCDDSLSSDGRDRLEQLLADPECRRDYITYMNMHARMLTHPRWSSELVTPADPAGGARPPLAPDRPPPRRPPLAGHAWVVAATLVVATVPQLVWFALNPTGARDNRPDVYVASLTQTAGCTWSSVTGIPTAGGRLLPGVVKLDRGVAAVRFDGGAELVLEGPIDLRIDSANSAAIRSGAVVFKTDGLAVPFALNTPGSVLRDLGTEYAVRVGPAGEEVHVFDGSVVRTAKADDTVTELVPAGAARKFDAGPGPGHPINVTPGAFVRLPGPPDEPRTGGDGPTAYEGFDYPAGPLAEAAAGGSGWVGPWHGDGDRAVELDPRGLDWPPCRLRPVGGCAAAGRAGVLVRRIAVPIRMDRDALYYVSYLVRLGHAAPGPSDLHLAFRDARRSDPTAGLRFAVSAGRSVVYVQHEPGSVSAPFPFRPDKPYLVVAKVVAGAERPDQVFVRVYGPEEQVGPDEPRDWSAVTMSFHSDQTFDQVDLSFRGSTPQSLDEVRVGTTWRSVAGWAAKCDPPR